MSIYYQNDRCTLYHGDVVDCLREMADESVQCVVTSPPYDDLRTYDGSSTWDFASTAQEMYRVLCEGGIVCWVVGDSVVDGSETLTSMRQAIYFKEAVGFRMHDTMIWEKTNFAHPEKCRYHQLFEYIFVLSKGKPRCFNPIKDKRNTWAGASSFGKNTMRKRNGQMKRKPRYFIADYGMRGNVWRCKTAGQENVCTAIEHPAVMPFGLCYDLVQSWSNTGDTVLDPMCGSGTTCIAALRLGRKTIGIDLNADYLSMALERIRPVLDQEQLPLAPG